MRDWGFGIRGRSIRPWNKHAQRNVLCSCEQDLLRLLDLEQVAKAFLAAVVGFEQREIIYPVRGRSKFQACVARAGVVVAARSPRPRPRKLSLLAQGRASEVRLVRAKLRADAVGARRRHLHFFQLLSSNSYILSSCPFFTRSTRSSSITSPRSATSRPRRPSFAASSNA